MSVATEECAWAPTRIAESTRQCPHGSLGSGRSRTHNRGNVEDAIALDIRQLQKVNALRPQHVGAVPVHSRNGRMAHLIICGDPSGNAIWVPHTARDGSEPFRIALE